MTRSLELTPAAFFLSTRVRDYKNTKQLTKRRLEIDHPHRVREARVLMRENNGSDHNSFGSVAVEDVTSGFTYVLGSPATHELQQQLRRGLIDCST